MIYVLSSQRFAKGNLQVYRQVFCGQPGRKLRWKQVQILHGPATVLTEPCFKSTEPQGLGRKARR